jgi:outer membrane lipoprotein carrier protein
MHVPCLCVRPDRARATVLVVALVAALAGVDLAAPPVATAQQTSRQAGGAPAADTAGAAARLDAVEARYRALTGLSARFSQVTEPDGGGASARLEGRLLLQGNKYRIETPEETLVTDGTTTWVYTPADSQVIVNDASDDPSTLSPRTFFTDYGRRYRAARMEPAASGRDASTVLHLVPRDAASNYETVALWVREDDVVTRLRVTDAAGTTYTISLDRIALNPGLGPSTFRFTPPDGVEVVDLRSS